MYKIWIKLLFICCICVIFFTSCEKYPIDALLGISNPVRSWPDTWYVYDDQFNTKGILEPYLFKDYADGSPNPYCDSWDNVILDFDCREAPLGTKCIKFSWVGNTRNIAGNIKTFIAFGMQSRVKLGDTIDISNSGYKYVKFYIKGHLYDNCKFDISVPINTERDKVSYTVTNAEISSNWEEKVIPIKDIDLMDKLEYVISLSLSIESDKVTLLTNGGTVYIDNIRFTKD